MSISIAAVLHLNLRILWKLTEAFRIFAGRPLAGNCNVVCGLWLPRAGFASQSIRSLLGRAGRALSGAQILVPTLVM